MKRFLVAFIVLPFTLSCGLPVEALLGTFVSSVSFPPRVLLLCAPILRDVDIQAIVIEINAGRDENVTKTAAIVAAGTTCADTATDLLAIADEPDSGVDFTALDAASYETDCTNCYIAIIDALYDD